MAEALREQYLPRFAGDALPATRTGMALSIADKLDTIAGIYATGQKPTGTRDPFGLRRAALGLLRTSIEHGLDLDLQQLIGQAVAAARADMARVATEQGKPLAAIDAAELAVEVYDYVIERLRAYYVEGGAGIAVTAEMFDAVLATRPASALDFDARLRALVQFLQLPDAASLAAANKRIANILKKVTEPVGDTVDDARLIDPAEQVLAEQVVAIAREVEPMFAARDYTAGAAAARRPAQGGRRLLRLGDGQCRRSGPACEPAGAAQSHARPVHARGRPVAAAGLTPMLQWIRSVIYTVLLFLVHGRLRRHRAGVGAAAAQHRAALRDPAQPGACS